MTNEIIHHSDDELSNENILEFVKTINVKPDYLARVLQHHHTNIFNEIVNRTSFLDIHYGKKHVPIKARLYCLEHHLSSCPTCQTPGCNNTVDFNKKSNTFRLHCCEKCGANDPNTISKRKNTMRRKYGAEHALQVKEFVDKSRQTTKLHYGVERPLQLEIFREKVRSTNRKRFGVDYPNQSSEIMKKVRETNKQRFGVENPSSLDEIKNKIKQTNLERRGVEWTGQDENIKRKIRASMLNHYGVEHALQSKEVMEKLKHTMVERHGVEFFSQSPEYHKKVNKLYTNPKYPEMTFGSSWEFKVYDFLTEHGIEFEYQPKISIPYEYMKIHHTYHPDFLVGKKIVEVKGDNFFRINKETGHEEMYCPKRRPEWTDEQYAYECAVYEAKHQCMLANNVIILREKDIKNLSVEMFQ